LHTADIRKWVSALSDAEKKKKSLNEDQAFELNWWVKMLADDGSQAKNLPKTINFAVMDYNMLDKARSSSNRGDYVQTLAALSNLLRFQNIEFVGGSKLANYLKGLQPRIHKKRRINGLAPVKVQPVEMHRDFS
jgi:hypothetical protein